MSLSQVQVNYIHLPSHSQRFFAIFLTFFTFLSDIPVIPPEMHNFPYTIKFCLFPLCVFPKNSLFQAKEKRLSALENAPADAYGFSFFYRPKPDARVIFVIQLKQIRRFCCFCASGSAAAAVCFHYTHIQALLCLPPHLL